MKSKSFPAFVGSHQVVVIPEPCAALLGGLGLLATFAAAPNPAASNLFFV